MASFKQYDTIQNQGGGNWAKHDAASFSSLIRAGFYLYQTHRKSWLLVLSFGTLTYLICDQMWLIPQTLLWPVYGWAFPKCDLTYWLQNILYALHTDPAIYIPELVGALILIWFALVIVRRKKVYAFLKDGEVL